MKRIFKTFPILLGILTVGLVISSGSAMGATQTTSQQIVGSGSDTTYYMMTALGDLYNQAPGLTRCSRRSRWMAPAPTRAARTRPTS